MATLYDLKPRFQALLRPLVRRLAALGVTANQVTVLTLVLSLSCGLLLAWQAGRLLWWLVLPPFLLLRMALNAMDGMLAREHGMAGPLGAMLNELGDVVADAALYLPLALVPGVSATAVVLAVLGAVLTEMTGVVAVQIGASRRYDGPMGKSDRAFAFGLAATLLASDAVPRVWISGLLWLVVVLAGVTAFNRARRALREIGA
ncbi:MAG TPA: CDP-alcohol phosphatidyltransferase family protein [Chromatiales bacterium]|nr:CDP-alcohol phosphatidyltransferase family protein [Chromatiales bacterium]